MTALGSKEKKNDSGAEELHESQFHPSEVEKFKAISYFLLLTMNKRTKQETQYRSKQAFHIYWPNSFTFILKNLK